MTPAAAELARRLREVAERAPPCPCEASRSWRRCWCVARRESVQRLARLVESGDVRVGVAP